MKKTIIYILLYSFSLYKTTKKQTTHKSLMSCCVRLSLYNIYLFFITHHSHKLFFLSLFNFFLLPFLLLLCYSLLNIPIYYLPIPFTSVCYLFLYFFYHCILLYYYIYILNLYTVVYVSISYTLYYITFVGKKNI